MARTSNNAFAKSRDQALWAWLDQNPSTARQTVEVGIFTNAIKARQRLRAGIARCLGIVNLLGHDEKFWGTKAVNNLKLQHEGELTELVIRLIQLKPKNIRRGVLVDDLLADLEIDFDDTIYFEHDRSTMGYGELLARIKGYGDCRDVLWSMQTQTRIDGIIAYARKHCYEIPPSVWFTTYEKALANIAGPWTNAGGQQTTLA